MTNIPEICAKAKLSGGNADRENYEKWYLWLYYPEIKSLNRQRKTREKLCVAVLSGNQEPSQTEKNKRKAVSGCTIRSSRAKTDRENHEKSCVWLYYPEFKSQNRQRKTREKLRVAVHSRLSIHGA